MMRSMRLLRFGRAVGMSLLVHAGAVFALWRVSPAFLVAPAPVAPVEVVLETAVSLETDHLPPLAEPPALSPPAFAEPFVVDPAVYICRPKIALASAAEREFQRPDRVQELPDIHPDSEPPVPATDDALAYWMPIRANLFERMKAHPRVEAPTNVLVRLLGLEDGVLVLEPAADEADALRTRVRLSAEEIARAAPPPPPSLVGRIASISVRFTAD